MNRGKVSTATGDAYASTPRPVVIVQDDLVRDTDSVVVVPLTTHHGDAPLTRMPVSADRMSGIAIDSCAMTDKVTTVRRRNRQQHVGRVTATQPVDMEHALLVVLGIAR